MSAIIRLHPKSRPRIARQQNASWRIRTKVAAALLVTVIVVISVKRWWSHDRDVDGGEKKDAGPTTPDRSTWNQVLRNLTLRLECTGEVNQTELHLSLREFASADSVARRTKNCADYFALIQPTHFLTRFGWNASATKTPGHRMYKNDFSIAFAHLVHTEPGIFELFMMLYFRPYNSHCIHIDAKTPLSDRRAILGVLRCYKERYPFSRIYLAEAPLSVYWGHVSLLDADLQCARQALVDRHPDFDAFVNVAGTELPFYPYEQFEGVLRAVAARNVVNSYPQPNDFQYRIRNSYFLKKFLGNRTLVTRGPNYQKDPVPYGLKIFKGVKNVILNRTFVEFLLYDQIAVDLYNWLLDVEAPEENFYSTLIRVTEIGQDAFGRTVVRQDLERDTQGDVCPRETLWAYWDCKGIFRNYLCVLGVGDLDLARTRGCLVINKFSTASDTTAAAVFCQLLHFLSALAKDNPDLTVLTPFKREGANSLYDYQDPNFVSELMA